MSLKVIILSRSSHIPSTRRLVAAASERGHSVRVIPPGEVDIHLDGRRGRLLRQGKRIQIPHVVIPRIAASVASYGLPVIEYFASHGAVVLNSAHAIGLSRNPARCLRTISDHGLEIPVTVMSRDIASLKAMVPLLGGPPILVKLLHGSERRGLMVCETRQSLEAAMEAVLGLGHNLVLQEYGAKERRDVRVFVVGGHALAAVTRTVKPFRVTLSLSRSGRMRGCEMTPDVRAAAEAAATVCGLEVCAVDVIAGPKSVKVFDVNASPELPATEEATGVDLARAIIEHAERLAKDAATRVSRAS